MLISRSDVLKFVFYCVYMPTYRHLKSSNTHVGFLCCMWTIDIMTLILYKLYIQN